MQTLTAAAPTVIAQFHGGAHNTATKIGSALTIVNQITTNLARGTEPLEGIEPEDVHPHLAEHAASVAENLGS